MSEELKAGREKTWTPVTETCVFDAIVCPKCGAKYEDIFEIMPKNRDRTSIDCDDCGSELDITFDYSVEVITRLIPEIPAVISVTPDDPTGDSE